MLPSVIVLWKWAFETQEFWGYVDEMTWEYIPTSSLIVVYGAP